MDAIAAYPTTQLKHRYFAYGSNIDDNEIHRTAPTAEFYATAFLPGYRLVFTKHAETRGGDAASIASRPCQASSGVPYSASPTKTGKRPTTRRRLQELKTTVYLTPPTPGDDPTPTTAFTFIAATPCPLQCGPPADYLASSSRPPKNEISQQNMSNSSNATRRNTLTTAPSMAGEPSIGVFSLGVRLTRQPEPSHPHSR